MKNIAFIKFILLIFLVSCSEEFLDVQPKDRITEEAFYKTGDHALQAITAAYDPLKHPTLFSQNFHYMFSAWEDRGVHENRSFENFNITANNENPFFTYTYLYKGVYRANVALQRIPPIEMDENLKTRLLAEARFLRALYNFYLTFVFYQPPLIEEPVDDINIKLSNSTREEFMSLIDEDLKFAIDNLPTSYGDSDVGRATKGAALTLLGKSYFYNQQWDPAKQYLQEVKNLADQGIYGLMTPQGNDSLDYVYAYLCNFSEVDFTSPNGTYNSENNKESIFEVQFEEGGWEAWEGGWQADGSLLSTYWGPFEFKNLIPTAEFVDQFEEAPASHPAGLQYDPRRYATVYETGDTILMKDGKEVKWNWILHTNPAISEQYGWKKYFYPAHQGPDGYKNDPNNIRLIRYADVLLMLAEADFHLNNETSTQLALDCINEVRNRTGLEPITEVTREAIIHERDVEFGFEFMRFFDLVRWSMLPDPWVNPEELMPGFQIGKNEYLPIPQSEIDLADGNLEQNPGWDEL